VFSVRQEIIVLCVMQTTSVFIGLSVCCWFSVLLSNVSKGALVQHSSTKVLVSAYFSGRRQIYIPEPMKETKRTYL